MSVQCVPSLNHNCHGLEICTARGSYWIQMQRFKRLLLPAASSLAKGSQAEAFGPHCVRVIRFMNLEK